MGTRLGGVFRLILGTYRVVLDWLPLFYASWAACVKIVLTQTFMPREILCDTCVHICDINYWHCSFFVLICFVEIFIEIEFVAQRPLAYCNFTMFYLFNCRKEVR